MEEGEEGEASEDKCDKNLSSECLTMPAWPPQSNASPVVNAALRKLGESIDRRIAYWSFIGDFKAFDNNFIA